MIRNYFLFNFRRLTRNKLSSLIKLISISLAMLCFTLVAVYVRYEFSFDRFHEKADRIVRLVSEFSVNKSVTRWVVTGTKTGPQLQRNFTQVNSYVRMTREPRIVARNDIIFDEKKFLFADSTFLNIFSFPLLEGNPSTALNGPNQVILTQSMARKYFGDEDPLGKSLVISGRQSYMITGLMKDVPGNSQITFDFVASFNNLEASKTEDWFPANYMTYLLLDKGTDINDLGRRVDKYSRDVSHKDPESSGIDYFTFHLEPLTSVHLHSDLAGLVPNTPVIYIYILVLIALLIIMIGCINYANLTIAQASEKKIEIGVRKVLGALRIHIFRHFIGESLLLTLMAAFSALMLALALIPSFNKLTGRTFEAYDLFHPVILGTIVLVCASISFLAGAYPAIVLSGQRLITILKPGNPLNESGGMIRRSLIIFQFVISVTLIIVTLVIREQRLFIQHKNIGYDKENVVFLRMDREAWKHYYELKDDLKQYPGIQEVTAAYTTPTVITWTNTLTVATDNGEKQFSTRAAPVDLDYLKTLDIKLLAGSDFTEGDLKALSANKDSGDFKSSIILNETAVKNIGWTPEEAIGREVNVGPTGIVKGVIRDFNIGSLHEPIMPLALFLDNQFLNVALIRVNGFDVPNTMAFIGKTWKSLVPWQPFDYHFLDEEYDAMYKSEKKTAALFTTFSSLAILLACLGLFGITALTMVQRTKEVGIRKVLGASAGNITILLSRDFFRLVFLAFMIAIPAGWYISEKWLQSFAYRVKMPLWVYFIAGLFALIIAMATVSYQSVKASLANPVDSLRNE